MGAPYKHAELSAHRFGGKPDDYIEIHELLDSSKEAMSDIRHRALTHNSWFVTKILERIMGRTVKNSEGKRIPVRDIAQWHIAEDFGGSFPSAQDYLAEIPLRDWMDNGKDGKVPPSHIHLPPFDQKLLIPPERKKAKKKQQKNPKSLADVLNGGKRITLPPLAENRFPKSGCGGGGRFD